MTTLTALRQAMTDFLEGQGIAALTAWPQEQRQNHQEPVAVVQVKEVEAAPAGFQNYLGQSYDSQAHRWTDRYGQRVTVKFVLTLCSPRAAGEAGCRRLLDRVAGALLRGGPAGFAVEKWTMGETDFDQHSGMFRGKFQAVCRGTLVESREESGEIVAIEVKGEMQL